jgi:hypothetical protein
MRNKVVEFFQNLPENKSEQFNTAFELYRETPTKSHSAERVYNASGYSETSLNNLLYDLQKLHDISDVEKLPIAKIEDIQTADERITILEEVAGLTAPDFPLWLATFEKSTYNIDTLLEFSASIENVKAIEVLNEIKIYSDKVYVINLIAVTSIDDLTKDFEIVPPTIENLEQTLEFALSVNNEIAVEKLKVIIERLKVPETINTNLSVVKNDELENENEELKNHNEDLISEKEDLQDENEELKNKLEITQTLPKINAESLRVEFPFLNAQDCPNELKILVADKITAWNEYLVLHDEISKIESGELILTKEELENKASRAIECFNNNQKIYEELNAYKETGKVLGKHPIFRTLQLTREVEAMSMDEKIKYKGSTSKFFSTNKKDLEKAIKAKDVERIELLNEKISERTEKLALVNKALGVK